MRSLGHEFGFPLTLPDRLERHVGYHWISYQHAYSALGSHVSGFELQVCQKQQGADRGAIKESLFLSSD